MATNTSKNPSETVTLEEVDITRDLDKLSFWLQDETVKRWWGNPGSRLEMIIKAPPGMHALICQSGTPVGYICWQNVIREELDSVGLYDVPDDLMDIDLFIGEPAFRGQGITPAALELLKCRLREEFDCELLGLATSIHNHSAISAFEKAGFRKRWRFDSKSYGSGWLMEHKLER